MNLNEILDDLGRDLRPGDGAQSISIKRWRERQLMFIEVIRKMAEGLNKYTNASDYEDRGIGIMVDPDEARETLATVEKLLQEGDV